MEIKNVLEKLKNAGFKVKSIWPKKLPQIKNEEEAGDNPYAFGYKEQAKNLVTRNRKQEKEVGQHIFSNTVRPVALIEDKVKINSLHSMEGLNRVYLMNTQRSPEKLVFN